MSTLKNWLICGFLLFFALIGVAFLPPVLYLFGAFFAFAIGLAASNSGLNTALPARPAPAMSAAPVPPPTTTRVELLERRPMPENLPTNLKCPSCAASIKPTDKKCSFCGSSLQPVLELPEPAKLANLEIGMSVRVVHPQKGPLDFQVSGRLLFTELWQASRGQNVPWTPTGNYFAGFALKPAAYLLNWQDRFYLLEEKRSLTDMDINRDFVPYARQFAQSDQTARVDFSYAGGNYRMVDIGRFAIEFEDGDGSHLHRGAVGRFIHAGSDAGQALVIDDFQSGGSGGQDTLWRGFLIKETDITY